MSAFQSRAASLNSPSELAAEVIALVSNKAIVGSSDWVRQAHQFGSRNDLLRSQGSLCARIRTAAAEYRRCQRDEFAHQVVTLQREIGRRLSGIRFRLESVAVRLDQHHRLRLTSFSRGNDVNSIAQRNDFGSGNLLIAKRRQVAGIFTEQRHRGGCAEAEFSLQPGLRRLNVADAEQRGVHAHLNLVDGFWIEAMLTANELCGVDRRMGKVTRCVVLEEIVADQEFSRESIERF